MPDLKVNTKHDNSQGLGFTNEVLQLNKWAYEEFFSGAIVDDKTGEFLKYQDLIKRKNLREIWETSLANKICHFTQTIQDIAGTNTMFFITESEILKDRLHNRAYSRITVVYLSQ